MRALLPLVEPALGPDAAPVRDALSQLQMAYAQLAARAARAGGAAPEGAAAGASRPEGAPQPAEPDGPGPGAEQRPALGARAVTPAARRVRRRPR